MPEAERVQTDAEILARYAASGDEAAFSELASRHGPMVYRVCLRILNDSHEAEDAAQATFIVLVRKAKWLRWSGNLAAWLHGVARHVCLKALRTRSRQTRHEDEAAKLRCMTNSEDVPQGVLELTLKAIDAELGVLSSGQRQALVLRYFEGHSLAEAAQIAGCPQGTLARRASDGMARLRKLLAARGSTVGAGALGTIIETQVTVPLPGALLPALVSASKTAAGGAAAAIAGGKVAALAEGAIRTMLLAKLKSAAVVFVVLTLAGVTATLLLKAMRGGSAQSGAQESVVAREGFKDNLYPGGGVFPLVMMDVNPRYFEEVKKSGFNCVHLYSSGQDLAGAKQYLEEARKHDLYVMQNMPSQKMAESKEWWAQWVKELARHDNLAWWYPPEESAASKIAHIIGSIRENDPHKRPVGLYLSWNSEKTIAGYKDLGDVVLKSSYPSAYEAPRVNVVSWMENIRNAGVRCNIAVAELWESNQAPPPNAHQLRFDHYAAVVMGSKGMCWYSWYRAKEKESCANALAEAKRFAWEVSGRDNRTPLAPAILSNDTANTIQSMVISGPEKSPKTKWWSAAENRETMKAWPAVLTLEKKHAGHTYLFAVNTAQVWAPAKGEKTDYTDATVKAEFSNLKGVETIEVLFENRSIPVQNGAFQDTFKELDVHIYRFETGR
jgi:RNA polymerase sigma factor (sigma-70 family)